MLVEESLQVATKNDQPGHLAKTDEVKESEGGQEGATLDPSYQYGHQDLAATEQQQPNQHIGGSN